MLKDSYIEVNIAVVKRILSERISKIESEIEKAEKAREEAIELDNKRMQSKHWLVRWALPEDVTYVPDMTIWLEQDELVELKCFQKTIAKLKDRTMRISLDTARKIGYDESQLPAQFLIEG